MLTETLIGALETRGIDGETASRLGWSGTKQSDGREFLAIPYFRDGVQVGRKYRTLTGEKKFLQDKGSEQCLYNLDAIKEADGAAIVITEGEMDCAIALQCGFLAVSVPNGAPQESVQGEGKKYAYLTDLPADGEYILAVDADQPGANLLHDLALRLGRHRCKWVRYPAGCKDLNDLYLKEGARGVGKAIREAEWLKIEGLYKMSALPPEPDYEPIDCPIDGMRMHYRIRQCDLTIITGIPSYGKTSFVNRMVANMALQHGWKTCFASFEQSPRRDHLRNLRTIFARRPAYLLPDDLRNAADAWIDDVFCFISPSLEDEVTLDWALEKCAAAVIQYGCKMIVLDPWNEMDHEYPREMSLTQYTGFAIKQLKRFARKYRVHMVVVAHPAKMQKNKDGEYPIPGLYDISDSSHWNNKADIGIVVHRDEQGGLVKVVKSRYHDIIGKPGEVRLKFDDYCYDYTPIHTAA